MNALLVDAFVASCACLSYACFAYNVIRGVNSPNLQTDGTLQSQPKPPAKHKPVILALLEVGDTIVLRNGDRRKVSLLQDFGHALYITTEGNTLGDAWRWDGSFRPIPNKLSDSDIVDIIKKKEPKMVDLSILEAGDTVTRRDGKEMTVTDVNFPKLFPVSFMAEGLKYIYCMDGSYFQLGEDYRDIVKITKKGHDMVDLSKAKKGDIVVLRCGLTDTIANICERTHNNGYSKPFEVYLIRGRFSFMKDGIWIEGEENEMDIVHVIHNPHNKTLLEIIEDGAKVERQKPMKFLFKGEKEPRELKVGDRLIHDSGNYYEVRKVNINGMVNAASVRAELSISINMANLLTSEDFLFVHASDKVVRHEEGDHGILKYKTADQYVVDTVEGLQIWPRDICTLI